MLPLVTMMSCSSSFPNNFDFAYFRKLAPNLHHSPRGRYCKRAFLRPELLVPLLRHPAVGLSGLVLEHWNSASGAASSSASISMSPKIEKTTLSIGEAGEAAPKPDIDPGDIQSLGCQAFDLS